MSAIPLSLPNKMPKELRGEFRSSHAGEVGAVWIYRGILLASADAEVRAFAKEHMQTEKAHVEIFEDLIHYYRGSLLLPLWILAGFLTGFIPGLFGRNAVFCTIQAVEQFVDMHYQQQIAKLRSSQEWYPLAQVLESCRHDEVSHRDDAARRIKNHNNPLISFWCKLVAIGSAMAVKVAKIG